MAPCVCYTRVDKFHGDMIWFFGVFFLEVTKPAVGENLVLLQKVQAEVEFPPVLTQPIRNAGNRKQMFQRECGVLG